MRAPSYTSREQVKAATDQAETARSNTRVDAAIESASRTIERKMHRRFYPWTGTRTLDWPPDQRSRSHVLWLGEDELLSVSALTAGGVTIPPGDFFPRPDNATPYDRLEINLAGGSAFGAGDTSQRAVSIAGVFGYCDDTVAAGALAEGLDVSETAVDVTDSAALGVGDLLMVGAERLLVTGKTMLSTGQTLQAPLTASVAAQTVAVTTGSAYAAGETLLLDAERMLVVDIAGNNLIVQRAHDGSTLAVHTGSTIYAPRTLTVERGAVGTTAAAHDTATAVRRHLPPGPISTLALAIAVCDLQQQAAGYARTAGSGDNERETAARGLKQAWLDADPYRRKARGPWVI